ncbi:ferritin-like protein [Nocardia sp. XZ_19_231]|uniref:ferritin-like domain-containing protein n=1 Tax=Nocardia sp. XZ_19_231 TaxID=2769252 RepID=UPI00188ED49D|nr:ferritin-like protein [Nocardia sp. XZ_19_231]
MLRINAQPLATDEDLRTALQNAIRLEHATIPPYLTALATLIGNSDSVKYARQVITDIVVEEMLHMTLACNIINAIGGHPVIADEEFVLKYPDALPMCVAGDLAVHLKRYSKALVEDTFMKIEEPEIPLDIPEMAGVAAVAEPITIGQFYTRIRAYVADHPELFTGDPELQVSGHFFDAGEDIRVTDVDSALLAIQTIVEQGEGTPKSPFDLQKDIAHYYAFQQLSKGMRIVEDASSPLKVSFDPAQPITIDDTADVIQMIDDPRLVTYHAADSRAEQISAEADASYSNILRALHRGFNGEPDKVGDAVAAMFEFKTIVGELLQQQLTVGDHAGQFAGPRFRYVVQG